MGLEVGQRVGDYEILSVLGAGGMGQVYRVRNTLSDRLEAMKVLLPTNNAEAETTARFMAEIRTLAAFSHPNIAQLRTAFHFQNQLVMLMELVDGQTIEYKAKRGRLPQEEALNYVLQLLSALSYAHARGVIHRDIKPANVMVTPQGVVKLMDFGIAKSELQAQLTRPGTTVGSLHYMSPEQMRGSAVDARSDLYSVGILLYELMAGRRPFESNGMYSVVHLQLNTPPQPPIEINPLISRPLNDLILQMLAKDPAQRLQSAEAFAKALRALIAQPAKPKSIARPIVAAQSTPRPQKQAASSSSSSAGAAGIFIKPVSSPPAPVARVVPQPLPVRTPSFWSRAGWVGVGAFAAIVFAGAAVELPLLFKTSASATTSEGSSLPPATAITTSANAVSPDMARAQVQMRQLESRAKAVHAKLESQPPGGDRQGLDKQYTEMQSHLQIAENDLKNRDIVAARREMGKAQKETSALESNLSH